MANSPRGTTVSQGGCLELLQQLLQSMSAEASILGGVPPLSPPDFTRLSGPSLIKSQGMSFMQFRQPPTKRKQNHQSKDNSVEHSPRSQATDLVRELTYSNCLKLNALIKLLTEKGVLKSGKIPGQIKHFKR
jgi:hypothetical protein